jgi:hypothetical protein
METTENYEQPEAEPGAILTFEAQGYLRESGKWAYFLGIIGFIFCGLFFIMALFIGTMLSALATISPLYAGIPAGAGIVLSVVFILFDVLYFFFALYLYQFAVKIKQGLMFADTESVTTAMGKLKSFFKLWGIVTIVALCLYALEIVGAVIISIAFNHR